MSESRFAIVDPVAGVSGDMLLGALISAGAPRPWIEGLPARLGLDEVSVEVSDTDRCTVAAVKVTVRLPGGRTELPSEVADNPGHGHVHRHDHGSASTHHAHPGGHGPHRHVGDLIRIVRQAPLSPWVRERAVRAFELLGEAEGRVHGLPPSDVPLHEVGALDALVDIVGVLEGFEQLGIVEVATRPIAVGKGWVRAAHGVLPVPAPATGYLLEGLPIGPNGPVEGEATTPTGAALLRVLVTGPVPDRWRPVAQGWGAGFRNPAAYPNALRLILAEGAVEAGEVVLVSTDVDDLSPEYLEPLREALSAAGALDVQVWATQMKKGRIGFRIEAMSPPSVADAVVDAFFRHSTTAGVRRWAGERVTLARREAVVPGAGGEALRVKLLDGPAGTRFKPEYDDVTAEARRTGRPALDVADSIRDQARPLARTPAARTGIAHKESE